jgi:hypothetical protein
MALSGIAAGLFIAVGAALTIYFTKQSEPPTVAVEVAPVKTIAIPASVDDARTITQTVPVVCTKPRLPFYAASAKPVSSPALAESLEEPKSAFKAAALEHAEVWAVAKFTNDPLAAGSRFATSQVRRGNVEPLLRDVPQVDLIANYGNQSKKDLAKAAQQLVALTKDDADAFVRKMQKTRPDLAGLPFLMGNDCKITGGDAINLRTSSLLIRQALSLVNRQTKPKSLPKSTYYSEDLRLQQDHRAAAFWQEMGKYRQSGQDHAVPALKQILGAEDAQYRRRFAESLKSKKGERATEVLLDLAIFDFDMEVRVAALEALHDRPAKQIRPVVVKALRYPWSPVMQNAAQVAIELDMKEMVPDLVAMLDEPDPSLPFAVKKGEDAPKQFVRELVRVNHHRNCMLCHAPIDENVLSDRNELAKLRQTPVGPVPSMEDELPPGSTTIYYSIRPGITVVRADITYLRQDFSMMQAVEKSSHWPEMQRFDFFVRTRELTKDEALSYAPPAGAADGKQSLLEALRALTGESHAASSEAWRGVLPKR